MTDAHALLAKAWEDDDPVALAALADKFDEDGVPDAGELIRLVTAELREPPHPTRTDELRRCLAAVNGRLRTAGWESTLDVALEPYPDPPALFMDTGDPADERTLVVWPGQAVYDLWVRVVGTDRVTTAPDGTELERVTESARGGRAGNPPPLRLAEIYRVTLGTVLGDLSNDTSPSDGRDLLAAVLSPAAIPVNRLPVEVLPVAAGQLASYLHAPWQRVMAGEVVPGAHLFEFTGDGWQFRRTLSRRPGDYDNCPMRIEPAPDGGDHLPPRLLVQVLAGEPPRPTDLIWGDGRRYTHGQGGRECLGRRQFEKAARDLGLAADAFAVDTADKVTALFRPR